jgi:hypothetical protein
MTGHSGFISGCSIMSQTKPFLDWSVLRMILPDLLEYTSPLFQAKILLLQLPGMNQHKNLIRLLSFVAPFLSDGRNNSLFHQEMLLENEIAVITTFVCSLLMPRRCSSRHSSKSGVGVS